MSMRRTFAISKRIAFGLLREPRTLVLVFLAPVLVMVLFGLALSGEVRHVRVVVVNLDRPAEGEGPSLSEAILAEMDREVLDLVVMEGEAQGLAEVEAGRASAVMIFPAGFTAEIVAAAAEGGSSEPVQAELELRLDRTISTVPTTISQVVQDAVTRSLDARGYKTPVHIDADSPVYGARAEFSDFFLPGVMGFACFFITLLLTILSFVGERHAGTLERLLTTAVGEGEIVLGYAVPFGVIGMVQSCLLLATATSIFHITVVGDVLQAFVPMALLSLVSLSFGMLLSIWARSELQAVQMVPLVILPTLLLSGMLWPLEAIPRWLRPVAYLIPPTHAVEAVRSIVGRGWGLVRVWPQLLALAGFTVLFVVGSILLLRRARSR